jgi:hypothetical protein
MELKHQRKDLGKLITPTNIVSSAQSHAEIANSTVLPDSIRYRQQRLENIWFTELQNYLRR